MKIVIIILFIASINLYSFTQDENDLLTASENSDIYSIRSIIKRKNININIQDKYGTTPLMYASINTNIYIADILIKAGANPNIKDSSGKTALMYAAESGNFEISQIYIWANADVNIYDNYMATALMYAANSNTNMVKLLVESGSQINATNLEGKTALIYNILDSANINIVNTFINLGADLDIQDIYGYNALMYASILDLRNLVKAFIKAGADLNKRNMYGKTALTMAEENKNFEIADILIQNGAVK